MGAAYFGSNVIDMVYAPPLLVAQIYNVRNEHWVLRLLLVSPTRTSLCLVFDPLCNKPYIVGANTEELAIVIAEQEGIEPRPQKRWDKFLGEFGSVAFAIAPLYSTFLHQEDGVSSHPACLLMLHCLLSRRVVNGSIQLPQNILWLSREIAQAALHYRDSAHASPIETTPSWALARMYARPYCSPSRSSCFFLRQHSSHHVPWMWSLSVCSTCFRFVSLGDMCGCAQLESAICCHTGMHCIGIRVG